jgi:hypothetical protein
MTCRSTDSSGPSNPPPRSNVHAVGDLDPAAVSRPCRFRDKSRLTQIAGPLEAENLVALTATDEAAVLVQLSNKSGLRPCSCLG